MVIGPVFWPTLYEHNTRSGQRRRPIWDWWHCIRSSVRAVCRTGDYIAKAMNVALRSDHQWCDPSSGGSRTSLHLQTTSKQQWRQREFKVGGTSLVSRLSACLTEANWWRLIAEWNRPEAERTEGNRKYVIIWGDIPVDVPPTEILGRCVLGIPGGVDASAKQCPNLWRIAF